MIETVLGPIAAGQLGITSMHEHLLSDARALADESDYVLDDAELAAEELRRAAAAGQRAVVDPTGWGFGGPVAALPSISRTSGVHIVAGVGVYLGRTRPDWITSASEATLRTALTQAIDDHIPGCDYRAGIIGVIAPDHPRSTLDRPLLGAASGAAATTGRSLILRLDPQVDDGPALVAELATGGLAVDRIVLSNVDGWATDPATLDRLAATGATLKWSFGYEAPPRAGLRSATDAQRVHACLRQHRRGTRQVLACGVWTRSALHAAGGFGYDHLIRTVLPALRGGGLDDDGARAMLIDEPARLLDDDAS